MLQIAVLQMTDRFREDFIQQKSIHANLASGQLFAVGFGSNQPMLTHIHEPHGKLSGRSDMASQWRRNGVAMAW